MPTRHLAILLAAAAIYLASLTVWKLVRYIPVEEQTLLVYVAYVGSFFTSVVVVGFGAIYSAWNRANHAKSYESYFMLRVIEGLFLIVLAIMVAPALRFFPITSYVISILVIVIMYLVGKKENILYAGWKIPAAVESISFILGILMAVLLALPLNAFGLGAFYMLYLVFTERLPFKLK